MIDVDKILGQILTAGQAIGQNAGKGESFAGGLLLGGLGGAMMGKGVKKMAGTVLQLGGAAAVAGLAYTAYQRYRAGQGTPIAAPAGQDSIVDMTPLRQAEFLPPPGDTRATETLSLKLIRAMIAAAKADGQIDNAETEKIFGQIDMLGLNDEERGFLLAEINKPLAAREVAASASTLEEAAEIYAVSVMAVNPKGLAERLYLGELSRQMKLEPALAQTIHDRVLSEV